MPSKKKNISTQIVCFIQLIPDRLQIKKKITRIIGRRNNETQTRRQEQRRNSRKAFKKKISKVGKSKLMKILKETNLGVVILITSFSYSSKQALHSIFAVSFLSNNQKNRAKESSSLPFFKTLSVFTFPFKKPQ
jgi:hypothetical protein